MKDNDEKLKSTLKNKLLMRQIFKTIWLGLGAILINTLANFILLFPDQRVMNLSYYVWPQPETIKINLIISGIIVLVGIIDWVYYYLYQPKLEADGQKGTADWVNERLQELKGKPKDLLEEERLVRIPFKEESPEKRGIILTTDEHSYYVDPNTTHNLVLGITGAGKSQTSVFPFIDLISRVPKKEAINDEVQESMIINDPKGELAASMAPLLKERGYEVKIVNLEEPYYSDSYDPYKLIKDSYTRSFTKSVDIQGDVSEAVNLINAFSLIMTNDPSAKDKFWQTTSKDLINGMIMAMLEDLVPSNPHLATPYVTRTLLSEFANTLTEDEERRLDWYFQEREVGNRAKGMAASAISASDKTKESIISNTLANLSLFSDEGIAKMTSHNTIEFNDIIKKPTAVFLICPDDDQSRWALASIFIEQSYYALTKAIKRDHGGESPRRINYILDEFAQMPPIPDMHVKLAMSRSRNIRWTLYLQDFNQLESKYDKNAPTIKNNCTNTIYLLTTDSKTAKEIEEKLGKKTVVSQSVSARLGEIDSNVTHNLDAQPLMHINELLEMPFEQGVVIRAGKKPIKANFRAAFRYLKLIKKSTRELVSEKAPHATINLSEYMDYLTDDHALTVYHEKNKKELARLMTQDELTQEREAEVEIVRDQLIKELSLNHETSAIKSVFSFEEEKINHCIENYLKHQDWDMLEKEIEKYLKKIKPQQGIFKSRK